MALIIELTKKEKPRKKPHEETRATYFFTDEGYLQIDTYGSEKRVRRGQKSQHIQLSPEIMQQLLEIWGRHVVEKLAGRDGESQ